MAEEKKEAAMTVQQLADGANAAVGKRANEMKKIEALKLRLKNLRAEHSHSEGASAEAAEVLRGKCENLLNLTRRIADGIHNKLDAEREEMELYRDAAVLLLSQGSPREVAAVIPSDSKEEMEDKEKKTKRESVADGGALVVQQKERISQLEEELKEREADVEALKKKNEETTANLKEIAEEAAENAELLVNLQMAELTRISSEEYNTVEDLKLALEKERLAVAAEQKKAAELSHDLEHTRALLAEAEARIAVAQEAASGAAAAVASSSHALGKQSSASESSSTVKSLGSDSEGASSASLGEEGGLAAPSAISSDSIEELPEARIARHYLNKLKLLEATFESDELLAKALYKDLGAEAIEKPARCGFLTKQGGAVKSWKRRYFVLKDNFLFYYKRVKDDTPIGVIQLEAGCAEEAAPGEIDKKNCFKLKTKNRVWWLHAERQIEMDIWIECVKGLSSWYENAQLKQPTVMNVRRATAAASSQASAPVRAAKKASKSFRISTYLATPSPK